MRTLHQPLLINNALDDMTVDDLIYWANEGLDIFKKLQPKL